MIARLHTKVYRKLLVPWMMRIGSLQNAVLENTARNTLLSKRPTYKASLRNPSICIGDVSPSKIFPLEMKTAFGTGFLHAGEKRMLYLSFMLRTAISRQAKTISLVAVGRNCLRTQNALTSNFDHEVFLKSYRFLFRQ